MDCRPSPTAAAGAEEAGGEAPPPTTYRIGYALSPKKVESFIQPSLLNLAKQRHIHLLPIDLHKPLSHQGPFDCLLHKLSGPDWTQQLRHFSSLHPDVPIIDPPDAVLRLHDRLSMLQVVRDLHLPEPIDESDSSSSSSCSFGIPHQVLVPDPQHLREQGLPSPLEFPVIAKPLLADGTASSHQMSLVFNHQGLKQLEEEEEEAPFVLQEFVNHGGVVFKVYVVGDYVQCVKRRSLPDILMDDDKALGRLGASHHNLLTFSQISNLAAAAPPSSSSFKNNDEQQLQEEEEEEAAQMPPVSFLARLAKALRNALGLHLFNFDVIRDGRFGNRYLVIDINYFPGYAKMPSYETVLTDFFLDLLRRKQQQ